jgi:hypothetical protein
MFSEKAGVAAFSLNITKNKRAAEGCEDSRATFEKP